MGGRGPWGYIGIPGAPSCLNNGFWVLYTLYTFTVPSNLLLGNWEP